MKLKSVFTLCIFVAGNIFLIGAAQALPLTNGNFSSGLSGWDSTGNTSIDSGAAKLADGAGTGATLSQGSSVSGTPATLTFDFNNALSDELGNGFRDSFFATLYLTNDLAAFDALNSATFLLAVDLFTYNGSTQQSNAGSFGASALGQGWSLFTYNFTPNTAFAVLGFELIDFNFIDNDSFVRLDNVSLTETPVVAPVPEPTTLLLVLPGLLAGRLRRKSLSEKI